MTKTIPSKFYLVFNFNPQQTEYLQELSNFSLKGIQGVSSNCRGVLFDFLSDRGAFLAMNGQSVMQKNKLMEIDYSDANMLIANSCKILNRIRESKWDVSNFTEQLSSKLNEMIALGAGDSWDKLLGAIADAESEMWDMKQPEEISTVSELSLWLYDIISKHFTDGVTPSEKRLYIGYFNREITIMMRRQAQPFSGEQEWIVNQPVFHIPQKSSLFVLTPDIPRDIYYKWKTKTLTSEETQENHMSIYRLKEILEIIKEYGLDTKYKVHIYTQHGFKSAATRILSAV